MEQTYFRKLQVVKEAKNEEEDNDDIELPESKRFESEKSDLFGDLDQRKSEEAKDFTVSISNPFSAA